MSYGRCSGTQRAGGVVGLVLALAWVGACDGRATPGEADVPDTASVEDSGTTTAEVSVDTGPAPDLGLLPDVGGAPDLLSPETTGDTTGDTEGDSAPPVCDETTCPPSDCLTCGDDGACVSLCDPPGCMACDGAGQCVRTCGPDEFCNAWGECEIACDVGCTCPNEAGYCTASLVDDIRLAPAAREATGEPGCCCDFDDDGEMDNGLAEMPQVMCDPVACPTLDDLVREALEEGKLRLLFEYVGLAEGGADASYFRTNIYLGVDTDGDPTNDFSGEATQLVDPISLAPDEEPWVIFDGASLEAGVVYGGPAQFILPLTLVDGAESVPLTLDLLSFRADLQRLERGVALSNGEACGVLRMESFQRMLNDFVAVNCDCLHLNGPYIGGDWTAPTCGTSTAEPTCDAEDSVESFCDQLGRYCTTAKDATDALFELDLDYDLDGTPDALSFGLYFSAVPVQIVGVAGADPD